MTDTQVVALVIMCIIGILGCIIIHSSEYDIEYKRKTKKHVYWAYLWLGIWAGPATFHIVMRGLFG